MADFPSEEDREKAHQMNRDLLKLIVKGKAANIDELDPLSSSTPLMMACEYLYD